MNKKKLKRDLKLVDGDYKRTKALLEKVEKDMLSFKEEKPILYITDNIKVIDGYYKGESGHIEDFRDPPTSALVSIGSGEVWVPCKYLEKYTEEQKNIEEPDNSENSKQPKSLIYKVVVTILILIIIYLLTGGKLP